MFTLSDDQSILYYANPSQNTEYQIPNSVITIFPGNSSLYAFQPIKNMVFSVSFSPNSKLDKIGAYAFYQCSQLKSIDFTNANSLTTIESYAFDSCTSLTEISFPDSLQYFTGYGAFKGCKNMTQVFFSDSSKLENLGSGTFADTGIETFKIPRYCKCDPLISIVNRRNFCKIANQRIFSSRRE